MQEEAENEVPTLRDEAKNKENIAKDHDSSVAGSKNQLQEGAGVESSSSSASKRDEESSSDDFIKRAQRYAYRCCCAYQCARKVGRVGGSRG